MKQVEQETFENDFNLRKNAESRFLFIINNTDRQMQ